MIDEFDMAMEVENAVPGPSTGFHGDSDLEQSEDMDDASSEEDVKPRRLQSKLDATLKGLMGEANVRYARGDIDTAKKMCFEVMRQVPDAFEPYITLSQIFENSDPTKYEGYLTIASCLCPHDSGIWCRLAELHNQRGDTKEAISCYAKAIRTNPRNIELHVKRLQLLEASGESRFALSCKRRMANKLPRSQYQSIIEISKEVAKKYHEENNVAQALEALRVPFRRIPKHVTQDLVNMMLEILLASNKFTECLDMFIQYCNFTFEITVDVNNQIVINSYEMPPNIQIDLKVKFIVCLIKLKSNDLLPQLIDSMVIEEDVNSIGDLYLDVAEDLMNAGLPHEALKLLIPLVKSSTYNLAAVWLKYAECLYNCDMLEQAVEAYFTVMTMAPQHVEVLYPLAMTLLKLNKKSEALEVLSQDLSANKVDVAVLVERMKLLRQIGDLEEYWKCAELLLSRHCVVLKYPDESQIVLAISSTINEKVKKIRQKRRFRGDNRAVETKLESIREPTVEQEYRVFRDVLEFALEQREYAQLEKFAFMALTSKRFLPYTREIMNTIFYACLCNGDSFHAYNIIRFRVLANPTNNLAWNFFNLVLQNTSDLRHNRFILRAQERFPMNECVATLEANYNLVQGHYNSALKHYMREFCKHQTPYLAFMLGVILLQVYARQSRTEDKKRLAEIASYLLLYYAQNRSRDAQHEVYYNVARMYHQLGVMYLAELYYKKVLELEDVEDEEVLGLKQEAAFNLHLIYRNSGNRTAARNVLIRSIVI